MHNQRQPNKSYLELVKEAALKGKLATPSTLKKEKVTKLPDQWKTDDFEPQSTNSGDKTAASEARVEAESWTTLANKMMPSEDYGDAFSA